jgi:hypothetical protein
MHKTGKIITFGCITVLLILPVTSVCCIVYAMPCKSREHQVGTSRRFDNAFDSECLIYSLLLY